jgi:hypothetical protein
MQPFTGMSEKAHIFVDTVALSFIRRDLLFLVSFLHFSFLGYWIIEKIF